MIEILNIIFLTLTCRTVVGNDIRFGITIAYVSLSVKYVGAKDSGLRFSKRQPP